MLVEKSDYAGSNIVLWPNFTILLLFFIKCPLLKNTMWSCSYFKHLLPDQQTKRTGVQLQLLWFMLTLSPSQSKHTNHIANATFKKRNKQKKQNTLLKPATFDPWHLHNLNINKWKWDRVLCFCSHAGFDLNVDFSRWRTRSPGYWRLLVKQQDGSVL